jgi:glutathione S-transferase
LVTAHECGLIDRIEVKEVDPWSDPPELHVAVPSGRIPALITDAGILLTESTSICQFLVTEGVHERPTAAAGVEEMSRTGLFQGLIDAAFTSVIEGRRPDAKQWDMWIERQHRAISRILAVTKAPPVGRFDLGDISLACGLAYLDFRLSTLGWRSQHPHLARWLDPVLDRASMASTNPMLSAAAPHPAG